MKITKVAMITAAGLAVGYLTSLAWRSDIRRGEPNRPPATAAGTASASHAGRVTETGNEAHDLATLMKRKLRTDSDALYRSQMERLSDDELKAVAGDLFVELKEAPVSSPRYSEALVAIKAATRELYQRHGPAALEWASGIDKEQGKWCIFQQMVYAAVEDSPRSAKRWVELYQKEFGGKGPNPFPEAAILAASPHGVEAALEVGEIFGAEMGGTSVAGGPLPADFDFKRLLKKCGESPGMLVPMHVWAAKDSEAAWQAMSEMDPDGKVISRHFCSLFSGMSQTMGEEAAAEWLAGRLDQLPAEARGKAVTSILGYHTMPYQVVETVMAQLPTEADRRLLAGKMVTPFAGDGPLQVLKGVNSPSERVEILVESARKYTKEATDPGHHFFEMVNGFYNKIVKDLNLSEEDRRRVIEAMQGQDTR